MNYEAALKSSLQYRQWFYLNWKTQLNNKTADLHLSINDFLLIILEGFIIFLIEIVFSKGNSYFTVFCNTQ